MKMIGGNKGGPMFWNGLRHTCLKVRFFDVAVRFILCRLMFTRFSKSSWH